MTINIGAVDTAGAAGPRLVRTSIYTRRDVLTSFEDAVNREYHGRLGKVPKHAIIANLLRIGLAHIEELPEYLHRDEQSTQGEER